MSTLSVTTLRGLATSPTPTKIEVASGHSLHAPGHVIQMQSTTTTSSLSTTATSLAASTHIVSITPKFANSKLLITLTGGEQTYSGSGVITGITHLYRQLTGGSYADISGQLCEQAMGGSDSSDYGHSHSSEWIDTTHNTTSAINYQTYIKTNSGTYYYNYTPTVITLRVMEIAQ